MELEGTGREIHVPLGHLFGKESTVALRILILPESHPCKFLNLSNLSVDHFYGVNI